MPRWKCFARFLPQAYCPTTSLQGELMAKTGTAKSGSKPQPRDEKPPQDRPDDPAELQEELDEGLEDSFPASDPPKVTRSVRSSQFTPKPSANTKRGTG